MGGASRVFHLPTGSHKPKEAQKDTRDRCPAGPGPTHCRWKEYACSLAPRAPGTCCVHWWLKAEPVVQLPLPLSTLHTWPLAPPTTSATCPNVQQSSGAFHVVHLGQQ